MFAVGVDSFTINQVLSMFSLTAYVYKQKTLIKTLNMIPCQPEQWKDLGQNYATSFSEVGL